MSCLSRILIYPVKSLDGQEVQQAELLPGGALVNDRRFALTNRQGDFINGKTTPALHRLRSHFDPDAGRLTLDFDGAGQPRSFDTLADRTELATWLSEYLKQPVTIIENTDGGFPDDTESPGPTLVSTGTLSAIAGWFGLTVAETRARFRANLEIEASEPFWEDRLVAAGLGVVRFTIGEVELLGTNPCQRCPVPTRNPYTGEPIEKFARSFAVHREESLPNWAPRDRFNHFYRLAVNTRCAQVRAGTLKVGDEITIQGVE
jgi:uncharacterized protein YcbX